VGNAPHPLDFYFVDCALVVEMGCPRRVIRKLAEDDTLLNATFNDPTGVHFVLSEASF
jgi:hypothetical protein